VKIGLRKYFQPSSEWQLRDDATAIFLLVRTSSKLPTKVPAKVSTFAGTVVNVAGTGRSEDILVS